ncbi:MAG: hypothetical protein ABIQ09_14940 [Jatrophihabitantaceae bacterium]
MTYPTAGRHRFFTPDRCPECGTLIAAAVPRCAGCGLLLTSPTASRLAEQLAAADQTMARLRFESQAAARQTTAQQTAAQQATAQQTAAQQTTAQQAAQQQGGWEPVAPGATAGPGQVGTFPRYPAPAAVAGARRWPAVSGAAIVLGLGGLCLLVAAIIFVSVSWGTLSLGAKAAVLAAVTAIFAVAAMAVTRRGLRGSAETLWASTLLDLTLDVWAIRRVDLAGWLSVDARSFTAAGAVAVGAVALGSTVATRRSALGRPLVSAQLILGGAAYVGLLCAIARTGAAAWLQFTVAVIGMTALAISARTAGLRVTAWVCGLTATQSWLGLVGLGILDEITSGPFVPRLWDGKANELPAAMVLALCAAGVPAVLRVPLLRLAAALAGLGLAAWTAWLIGAHYLSAVSALAGVLLGLALLSLVRHPLWNRAVLLVLGGAGGVSVLVLLRAALAGISASTDLGGPIWQRRPLDALLDAGQPAIEVLPSLALLAAATATALLIRPLLKDWTQRWSAPGERWIAAVAGPAAFAIWLNVHPPLLVATLGWLLLMLAGLLLARRGGWLLALLAMPGLLLALALITALASEPTTILAFAAGAGVTLAAGRSVARDVPALRQACELTAVTQLFVLIAAGFSLGTPGRWTPAVAGLLGCAAVLGVVAARSPARRWWFWPAVSAVIVAGWIEAGVHSMHAPELYSTPVGLLALAFGVQVARREPASSSWLVYGPGLLILTVALVAPALREPLSWRALALGVIALLSLLVGARLKLQAPLVIGAAEVALLVVTELSPYALGLPRWVVIGTVGVLLLTLGVTWESRLAELRSARRLIADML